MNAWMWLAAAIVTAIVWFAGLRGKKSDGDILLSAGDESQKSARRAERAREYAVKYPTMNGNWNQ